MIPKVVWAALLAAVCAAVAMILARHHTGPFPQPAKALWDMAFFVGVLISGNVHQPSGLAIAAFFFALFFAIAWLALYALQKGK